MIEVRRASKQPPSLILPFQRNREQLPENFLNSTCREPFEAFGNIIRNR
jgi:hypothetical protein